jgi:biotin carboxylase
MKNKIIIAEAMSSAFNYLDDIRKKGYEPVILETYFPDGYAKSLLEEERREKYSRIQYPVTIIKEDPDYAVTLEKIKELDPLLVMPGCEDGVVIGTHLADDLGMPCTPFSNIDKMTKKSAMHQALKEAGLRYIRGEEVATEEECLSFLERTGTEDVVLKHAHGCASVGLHLVHGKEELLEAFRTETAAGNNMFGEDETRLLLQERIFGDEYVVNTISRNGVPALLSVFRYYKTWLPSGACIYRGLESVSEFDEREKELVEYALQTVRAVGIVDGPVHGEYMIDGNGPVLIEVNCRVMGGSMPAGFLDKVYGYHDTEVILDCMLDPAFHGEFLKRPYHTLRRGYTKDFYSDRDRPINASGIVPILLSMKSFYSGWVSSAARSSILQETKDLKTETGCIYMVHDDSEVTKKEFWDLMEIEEKHPELLHSNGPLFQPPEDAAKLTPEMAEVLERDPETLILDIILWLRNGKQGTPVVPEDLVSANDHNREIMEWLEKFI